MTEFTSKYAGSIAGTVSGFDRLVFRGSLRKIAYPFGREGYRWANQVPLTGLGAHVNATSERVKESSVTVRAGSGTHGAVPAVQQGPQRGDCTVDRARTEDHRRPGVRVDVRGAVLGLRYLSQSGNQAIGLGATIAHMPVPVSVLAASGVRVAEGADPDLVSVFDPDLHEGRTWLARQREGADMGYRQQD